MKTRKKMEKRKKIEYMGEEHQVSQCDWGKLEEGFIACGMQKEVTELRNAKPFPIRVYSHPS